MKEERKPEYPEKTPGDELKKIPHFPSDSMTSTAPFLHSSTASLA